MPGLFPKFTGRLASLKSSAWKGRLGLAAGALLSIASGLLLFLSFGSRGPDKEEPVPLGQRLIDWSYDLPFALRRNVDRNEAVIVYMDENAHAGLNQPYRTPWNRALHAELLRFLKKAGAKIVVFDILFEDVPDPANQRLADAMDEHGKVIIAANLPEMEAPGVSGYQIIRSKTFDKHAVSGLAEIKRNPSDFGARQMYLGKSDQKEFLPSIGVQAAISYRPASITHSEFESERWINYYGPPVQQLTHVSYWQATNQPNIFRDKVVFIGELPPKIEVTGVPSDLFRTPYTYWYGRLAPGVEVHATTFLNIIHGDWLREIGPVSQALVTIVLGALLGVTLVWLRPWAATAAAILFALVFSAAAVALVWKTRVWFPWLIAVGVQLPVALAWGLTYNSFLLYAEQLALQRTLELHLSPARVKQILKRPDLLKPGAEKQEISVIFTDIANFSRITARMNPDDLFRLLNQYFQESLACIHETDGTVIKLIGDAIFAIWNAPFTQPDQQERACRAALLLRERLVEFNKASQAFPLRTRVGLHMGDAFVGNVGSAERFDYTAIGETINLASRLEGLNKHLGTDVLATRDIQKVVEGSVTSRRVGYFKFKGFDRIVEVHEVVGTAADREKTRAWRETFEGALLAFQRKDFAEAEAGFSQTLAMKPEDGPSRFYLQKLREFGTQNLSEEWAGEINMEEK